MSDYGAFAAALTAGGVISDPWFEGAPRFRAEPVVLPAAFQGELYRAAEAMAAAWNEACLLCEADPSLATEFLRLTPVQHALWLASAPEWHGIARADVFATPQGLRICELNCDTPTGEAEATVLGAHAAALHPGLVDPNAALQQRFCDLIAALGEPRSVGIIYPTEIAEDLALIALYQRWFEARGWKVTLGSPFNLRRFRGGRAGLFDTPCDVFVRHYKTDWWTERLPAWADEEPVPDQEPLTEQLDIILRAAIDGACRVVNPFGAVVPQNKRAMALMWERQELFSAPARDAIRRYLPETYRLESMPRPARTDWVLKSDYGCEGDEVVIGALCDDATWAECLDAALPGRWVAQRYFESDGTNHGVYLIAGEAAGLYVRVSPGATDRHALSAPVLVAP